MPAIMPLHAHAYSWSILPTRVTSALQYYTIGFTLISEREVANEHIMIVEEFNVTNSPSQVSRHLPMYQPVVQGLV